MRRAADVRVAVFHVSARTLEKRFLQGAASVINARAEGARVRRFDPSGMGLAVVTSGAPLITLPAVLRSSCRVSAMPAQDGRTLCSVAVHSYLPRRLGRFHHTGNARST